MSLKRILHGLFLLTTSSLALAIAPSSDVQVNLRSPVYEDGVLTTEQGGVLEGEFIRIQATHITYVKKECAGQTEWFVKAHGNLMVKYSGKTFVGDSIEYNFNDKQGIIINGRTQIGLWFIGGKQILLKPDNSYELKHTTLTTCESGTSLWELHVNKGTVHEYDVLTAKNAQVRLFKVPIFWFPYLKAKLSTLQDIPAYYSFITGGSQGQIISMRYLAYSSPSFKSYLQLDFWFKKGPSGSVQFDYKAPNHPTTFQANNFVAYDKQANNPPTGSSLYNMLRQRYVGELNTQLWNKLYINGQYEKLSDAFVLETYFNRYYFLQTMRQTHLEMRMHEDRWLSYIRGKVRINRFQTVSQELPIFAFNLKPFSLGKSGFIGDGIFNVGYLDYVYGSYISNTNPNFRSARMEIKPRIYYPIHFKGFTVTAMGEYVGVGYSQSPAGGSQWNNLAIVGGEANYKLSKIYSDQWRHTIEPYTSYQFMSNPTVSVNEHYFFDFDDSYAKINQLCWGLRNYIYRKKNNKITTPLKLDVYTYGFFNNTTIGSYIPRLYVDITKNLSFAYAAFSFGYNLQHGLIDFANVRTALTFSEDFALSFLFMHRSKYDYKKAINNNYLLDVYRSQADLLASPLSDQRNITQSKLYWRIFRNLIFEFESRQGWHRVNAPPFNEMRFNVTFLLPCNWRLTFSPQRTISPNSGAKNIWRWHVSLQLGGKPPKEMSKPYIFW